VRGSPFVVTTLEVAGADRPIAPRVTGPPLASPSG